MFPKVPKLPNKTTGSCVDGVKITIQIQPWLSAFISDLGELTEKAVRHGLPEEVAKEQVKKFIKEIAPYAVNVK